MVQILWLIRDKVLSLFRDERAQDTFEYVLIIGAVTVAVITLIAVAAPNLMTGTIHGVCLAVKGIVPDVTCV